MIDEPEPRYFPEPAAFRAWLEENHERAEFLWVGYHKKGTGKPSLTWPESVDEALCFGWIDGLRKRVDDERYKIRFTPRKPRSNWSAVNIARVEALTEEGRMRPAGLAAYEKRSEARSEVYSYEQKKNARFEPEQQARLRADAEAWKFFRAQPEGYRRNATFWVTGAKRAATRERRLSQLIDDSRAGRLIPPLRRPSGKK